MVVARVVVDGISRGMRPTSAGAEDEQDGGMDSHGPEPAAR